MGQPIDSFSETALIEPRLHLPMFSRPKTETIPEGIESAQHRPSRQPFTLSATASLLILLGAGLFSAWLYLWGGDLHRFTQWITAYISLFIGQFALYLLACFAVSRMPVALSRRLTIASVAIVLVFAAAYRVELVGRRPFLSTDAYRYLWDGKIQASGINPYRYLPAAPELTGLRDNEVYPKINRADYESTPYPPGAQVVYLAGYLVSPMNLTGFKLMISFFDLISILLVMLSLSKLRMNPAWAVILAWHPLLVWEGAHSGHVESAFIMFLSAALLSRVHQRSVLTGVFVGMAALVKFYPALVLPALMFRPEEDSNQHEYSWSRLKKTIFNSQNLKMAGAFMLTVVAVYLPYLSVGLGVFGSLPGEFQEEGFTGSGGSRYFFVELMKSFIPISNGVFTVAAAATLGAAVLLLMTRRKITLNEVAGGAVTLIGLFLLLATPRYSWYYAWILPFLCIVPRLGWLYLTGASVLLYLVWFTPNVYPNLPIWLGVSIYLPTLIFLWWGGFRKENRFSFSSTTTER